MIDLDPDVLRAAYDAQLRAHVPDPLPSGVTVERDGPLVRMRGLDEGGFITYHDLGGLSGPALDELIGRQRDLFAGLGERVEWKLHGHDEPTDLADRLRAAGFVPEEEETVLIGPVAALAPVLPVLPEGIRLREVTERADLERIGELKAEVYGVDFDWLIDGLARELAADGADQLSLTIVVAEETGTEPAGGAGGGPPDRGPGSPGPRAGEEPPGATVAEPPGRLVSAGWVRFVPGTRFATLWGGSTLPRWRRRGIYRALVTYRARLAQARDCTLLQVDASPRSRPILQRLGFVPVTTTTPYVYTP